MSTFFQYTSIDVVQNMNQAISVMRSASKWMKESGKKVSKWWRLENLNSSFLLQYAKPEEFYVVLIGGVPGAAAVLQSNQNSQDWEPVDGDKHGFALYIHWLCIDHRFAGKGLPKIVVDFAEQQAHQNNIDVLRADTNANELKLRGIYENLGFTLINIKQEDYRQTAFYEKRFSHSTS